MILIKLENVKENIMINYLSNIDNIGNIINSVIDNSGWGYEHYKDTLLIQIDRNLEDIINIDFSSIGKVAEYYDDKMG